MAEYLQENKTQNQDAPENKIPDVEVQNVEIQDENTQGGEPSETKTVAKVWKVLAVLIAITAVVHSAFSDQIIKLYDSTHILSSSTIKDFGQSWIFFKVPFLAMATLNLYQQFSKDQSSSKFYFIKVTKWILAAIIGPSILMVTLYTLFIPLAFPLIFIVFFLGGGIHG